jgi:CBS domain containing-hemolysin-like protein
MRQLARREQESPGLIEGLVRRLRALGGAREPEASRLHEALAELLDEAPDDDRQRLGEKARELLLNALSFGELRVDDVMVPRADIRGVPSSASLSDVVQTMRHTGHSRLVVYRGSLDDVLGLVNVKDLLVFWGDGEAFDLEQLTRPILIVPPSMRVLDLLVEMRDKHTQMAVVVDEFGGTDGLVTLEDLVAEIIGELQDEHDQLRAPQLVENPDGTVDADARVWLDDLETALGIRLLEEEERDEADTLGGLIFNLLDRVPAKGEVVPHPSGLELEVTEADPRRIKRVRIHRLAEARAQAPRPPASD